MDLIEQVEKERKKSLALKEMFEKKVKNMEVEIQQVHEQRDTVLKKLETQKTRKLGRKGVEKYDVKIKTLNKELTINRQKLKETQSSLRQQAMSDARLKRLQGELHKLKREKVGLQKRRKEEADKHREMTRESTRKLKIARKQNQKMKYEMKKIQSKCEAQSRVLKRKNEENSMMQKQLRASKKKNTSRKRRYGGVSQKAQKSIKKKLDAEIKKAMKQRKLVRELSDAKTRLRSLIEDMADTRMEVRLLKNKKTLPQTSSKQKEAMDDQIIGHQEDMENFEVEVRAAKDKVLSIETQLTRLGTDENMKKVEISSEIFKKIPLENAKMSQLIITQYMKEVISLSGNLEDHNTEMTELESKVGDLMLENKEHQLIKKRNEVLIQKLQKTISTTQARRQSIAPNHSDIERTRKTLESRRRELSLISPRPVQNPKQRRVKKDKTDTTTKQRIDFGAQEKDSPPSAQAEKVPFSSFFTVPSSKSSKNRSSTSSLYTLPEESNDESEKFASPKPRAAVYRSSRQKLSTPPPGNLQIGSEQTAAPLSPMACSPSSLNSSSSRNLSTHLNNGPDNIGGGITGPIEDRRTGNIWTDLAHPSNFTGTMRNKFKGGTPQIKHKTNGRRIISSTTPVSSSGTPRAHTPTSSVSSRQSQRTNKRRKATAAPNSTPIPPKRPKEQYKSTPHSSYKASKRKASERKASERKASERKKKDVFNYLHQLSSPDRMVLCSTGPTSAGPSLTGPAFPALTGPALTDPATISPNSTGLNSISPIVTLACKKKEQEKTCSTYHQQHHDSTDDVNKSLSSFHLPPFSSDSSENNSAMNSPLSSSSSTSSIGLNNFSSLSTSSSPSSEVPRPKHFVSPGNSPLNPMNNGGNNQEENQRKRHSMENIENVDYTNIVRNGGNNFEKYSSHSKKTGALNNNISNCSSIDKPLQSPQASIIIPQDLVTPKHLQKRSNRRNRLLDDSPF